MKKFKKIIASFITLVALFVMAPVAAHAEWKSDNMGWWYTEGNSWATGWRQIDGNWYYFNSSGYIAHDTTIDGYYLGSNGVWTANTSAQNTNDNVSNTSSVKQYVDANGSGLIKGSVDYIYHIPGSTYYDRTKKVQQWFKTIEEAEAAGYRAAKK
ncbi:MAG: hypothetical protein E7206_00370 [Clostridium beijerinckii]|nr:hypothetical protein [Clostridium beijerinckii]